MKIFRRLGVSRGSMRVIRAIDGYALHTRIALYIVDRAWAALMKRHYVPRLDDSLRRHSVVDKRNTKNSGTGGRLKADLQPGFDVRGLPFVARRVASDFEQLDPRAVQPDIQLMRLFQSADNGRTIILLQMDLDDVLAVEWKLIANRDPASRTER